MCRERMVNDIQLCSFLSDEGAVHETSNTMCGYDRAP